MRSNPPRLVRTYNNTVNFESSLVGRCLLSLLLLLLFLLLPASQYSPHRFALDLPNRPTSTVSRTILRGSLNRQQFQPLNNSWRSNLTANKLDRISRDLERAPKPRSLSLSLYPSIYPSTPSSTTPRTPRTQAALSHCNQPAFESRCRPLSHYFHPRNRAILPVSLNPVNATDGLKQRDYGYGI